MRHVKRVFECCAVVALSIWAAGPTVDRSYTAGKVAAEIGSETQFVSGVEGGSAVADVIAEKPGADRTVRKHLSGVRYDDIVIDIPPTAFASVIENTLNGKGGRYNGALRFADMNFKEKRRQTFQNALVTGVKFPAMDAGGKDAVHVELTLSPEVTKEEQGKDDVLKGAPDSKSQKSFSSTNFRVKLDELPTAKVNKISAIEFRSQPVQSDVGAAREYEKKEPAGYEIPNIMLTMSATEAPQWQKWHEDFVIKGMNGAENEKTLIVEYLSTDLKTVLMSVEVKGVGIVAVRSAKAQATADSIQRIEVELYAETAKLIPSGPTKTAEAAPAAKEAAPAPAAAAAPAKEAAADPAMAAAPTDAAPVAKKKKKPVEPAAAAAGLTPAEVVAPPATAPAAKPVKRRR